MSINFLKFIKISTKNAGAYAGLLRGGPNFKISGILDIDGHESKPAISILAIVQESPKTSAFRYFSSYSFYFIT